MATLHFCWLSPCNFTSLSFKKISVIVPSYSRENEAIQLYPTTFQIFTWILHIFLLSGCGYNEITPIPSTFLDNKKLQLYKIIFKVMKSRKLLQHTNNEGTSKIAIKFLNSIVPNCRKRNWETPIIIIFI